MTFDGWRTEPGGLQGNEAKRLKKLEANNSKLTKLFVEAQLDLDGIKVALEEKRWPNGSTDRPY